MTKKHNSLASEKLWDEILKSIVGRMPKQVLPLIEDVFGISYPADVKITLLPTETTLPKDDDFNELTSIYSDIALKIDKDIYHFECEIKNDDDMSIRMVKYDFHLGLFTSLHTEKPNTLVFPRSVVIYHAPNDNIPDELTCHLVFADGSTHDYKGPTVKVQKYSLDDIRQKHLTLFLPYKLLQFRPRLKSKTNPLTESELTAFVDGIILILKEELIAGRLTQHEYEDYIELIDKSAKRVFNKSNDFKRTMVSMTKSLITLPSERYEIYEKQLAEKDAELHQKDAEILKISKEKDREIAKLKKQLAEATKHQ